MPCPPNWFYCCKQVSISLNPSFNELKVETYDMVEINLSMSLVHLGACVHCPFLILLLPTSFNQSEPINNIVSYWQRTWWAAKEYWIRCTMAHTYLCKSRDRVYIQGNKPQLVPPRQRGFNQSQPILHIWCWSLWATKGLMRWHGRCHFAVYLQDSMPRPVLPKSV